MSHSVSHLISLGAITQAALALAGALPAISTVMGIIWFLLVFPSTVTEFLEWCRKYIRWSDADDHAELLAVKAEIERIKAEANAWNPIHSKENKS